MRPPVHYDQKMASALTAMYDAEDGTYDSYTLTQKLNPNVQFGTREALNAFNDTRATTENLIVMGLVHGLRQTGADGIYFKNLKLTRKGEQAAIKVRRESEEVKDALNDIAKKSSDVAKEME